MVAVTAMRLLAQLRQMKPRQRRRQRKARLRNAAGQKSKAELQSRGKWSGTGRH